MERAISDVEMEAGLPTAFAWQERQYVVREVLDDWEEAGCWWLDEEPRRVYRVLTDNDAIYELHRLPKTGWELHRVYD
ncbi:MAG TPA: DUF6504 family protein [Armatimonadota bacterium]|nr:DUF6504 family protein [Armatimonadota bacterium]